MGCDGGNADDAFWYVQTNGIESLATYPDVSNMVNIYIQNAEYYFAATRRLLNTATIHNSAV
jgi:hypothetical protein